MRISIIFIFIILLSCKSEEIQNIIPNSTTSSSRDKTTVVVEVKSKTGRIWMDRNLGASQVAISPTDDKAFGDLYQWGRGADGHQLRSSITSKNTSPTDVCKTFTFILPQNEPFDWRIPQNNELWQGVNGINNPCPEGFRLPTERELQIERQSWKSGSSESAFNSPLKWQLAGARYDNFIDDAFGKYWSSTVGGVNDQGAKSLFIAKNNSNLTVDNRFFGQCIRCIKD